MRALRGRKSGAASVETRPFRSSDVSRAAFFVGVMIVIGFAFAGFEYLTGRLFTPSIPSVPLLADVTDEQALELYRRDAGSVRASPQHARDILARTSRAPARISAATDEEVGQAYLLAWSHGRTVAHAQRWARVFAFGTFGIVLGLLGQRVGFRRFEVWYPLVPIFGAFVMGIIVYRLSGRLFDRLVSPRGAGGRAQTPK